MEAIKQIDGTWDIEGLEPWQQTFNRMCDMLREGINFKFARYGDGEIFCMNGKIGRNCDKHEYFPDLGLALHNAIKRADYMVGIQPLSVSQKLHETISLPIGKVYNADVLHNASIRGLLDDFIASIKGRDVYFIGPTHLILIATKIQEQSSFELHPIPRVNCWQEYNAIQNDLYNGLREKTGSVVLLCASMMSEVLIDSFRNMDHTFIDCGSVFDPYCGVKSRRYHETLKV